jgi:hypothetical protein
VECETTISFTSRSLGDLATEVTGVPGNVDFLSISKKNYAFILQLKVRGILLFSV